MTASKAQTANADVYVEPAMTSDFSCDNSFDQASYVVTPTSNYQNLAYIYSVQTSPKNSSFMSTVDSYPLYQPAPIFPLSFQPHQMVYLNSGSFPLSTTIQLF